MTEPTTTAERAHTNTAFIEKEMQVSYLDYAMSVIVGRALPDVRDGLKPVHRRILYAMNELNNGYNTPYKKSARIVGDVIGKYHPHGDSAVYDSIVRMAQPFSMRHVLVDGQGNFGSVDGDAPAAMRYTEIRMARITHALLADIGKNTVDFRPNYDGSEQEPSVLPTRIPNLLINGTSGIAVGMATNIPPHNLGEVIDATIALIDNPALDIDGLMMHMPGPDFPTAAHIHGAAGIRDAYHTGRGSVIMRAVAEFEEVNNHTAIIVRELPYQVNKAHLIEHIAGLVKDKKITAISALRDESDKQGMRVVMELKRGEVPEIVLNHLYKQTALQKSFGVNMVALVKGKPKLLDIKSILEAFLSHRAEVVTRRTLFDLAKAQERVHLLEGLAVALANIDAMIALIRNAATPTIAKEQLLAERWPCLNILALMQTGAVETAHVRPEGLAAEYGVQEQKTDGGETDNASNAIPLYRLSPQQAAAILDLRLHRLTGLEQDKIVAEFQELLEKIRAYLFILHDRGELMRVIREELLEARTQFVSPRRTVIHADRRDLSIEDLIVPEEKVITLSLAGYMKAQKIDDYRAQRRGGRGRTATKMKAEDIVDKLFIANSHDWLLCFTSFGKVYWKKVYEIPTASAQARGIPIVNLLALDKEETVSAVLPVKSFDADASVFMATAFGTVKKTPLRDFSRPRAGGIIALNLAEGDRMVGVNITNGTAGILLFSSDGQAVHFHEQHVRSMGRTAAGVRGMRINDGAQIVSMIVADDNADNSADIRILTATEHGYGKRTALSEYAQKGRGIKGVKSIVTNDRNGQVVAAVPVLDEDVMLISNGGTLVRIASGDISQTGRNTQGVRLIKLDKGERLVGLALVVESDDDTDEMTDEATGEVNEAVQDVNTRTDNATDANKVVAMGNAPDNEGNHAPDDAA